MKVDKNVGEAILYTCKLFDCAVIGVYVVVRSSSVL